jgi:hypothetical protein
MDSYTLCDSNGALVTVELLNNAASDIKIQDNDSKTLAEKARQFGHHTVLESLVNVVNYSSHLTRCAKFPIPVSVPTTSSHG